MVLCFVRFAIEYPRARQRQKKFPHRDLRTRAPRGVGGAPSLVLREGRRSRPNAAKKAGVPEKYIPYLQDGARALIEKGSETVLDKALDQTGLNDTEKKALKAAIEAAAKTKPK